MRRRLCGGQPEHRLALHRVSGARRCLRLVRRLAPHEAPTLHGFPDTELAASIRADGIEAMPARACPDTLTPPPAAEVTASVGVAAPSQVNDRAGSDCKGFPAAVTYAWE